MAKIKNVSGIDLIVPALNGRLVLAGAVVDVDESEVYGFTCQVANWAPVDKAAQKVHDAGDPLAVAANTEPAPAPDPTEG